MSQLDLKPGMGKRQAEQNRPIKSKSGYLQRYAKYVTHRAGKF